MRPDVLELMAEEISGRPVGKLASFVSFESGRARLNGMQAGKRYDVLDREQRAFDAANKIELRRLSKRNVNRRHAVAYNESSKAWHKANRARRTKYEREYRAAHIEKARAKEAAKRKRQKSDPTRWALVAARWKKYRAKKKGSK